MKLRLVAALLLLLVAVGLPLAAMSDDGPPWGFRGHHAVLIETTGTVEATASEQRRERTNSIDDKLEVAPNLHFDAGDEIRVARLGQARVRFPGADVVIGDGARVLVGIDSLTLARGVVDVTLRDQAQFTIALDAGGTLVARGNGAHVVVLADGKGGTHAFVKNGTVEARAGSGADRVLEAGKLLVVRGDDATIVEPPTGLEVSATCSAAKLNIVAPAHSQVFAAGALSYPDVAVGADTGSVVLDLDAGAKEAFVLGRNVYGHVGQTRVVCDKRK